mmetsp:Transcript_140609/g.365970  ORF Transcript_140609/g.365970 Transcript_140609/m.365970 type:complete len:687 (-) Transcript_140609:116-2176(-)
MEMSLHAATEPELQEQVIKLTQEKRELQDYAERVTRELRRYQQSRPPPAARPDDDLPLPPWATNMQMMSPLLFAYEERIAELEAVIERSVSLAEQAQVLTKENDALRVELQERTEQLRNAQLLAPVRELGQGGGVGEQSDEIQELYRLSVEQNEALAQQNQLLKLQLERMQQTLSLTQQQAREVQARAAEGSKVASAEQEAAVRAFQSEQESAQRALSAEQQRAGVYARQRGAAEQRLEEITSELVEEVRSREHLQTQVEGLQQELQLQGQSLDFYKKSFDDRCAMAVEEEERLQAELERTSHSERGLRQRVAHLERELGEVTEQVYAARREGDATKQEAEQMLRLMESMEKRLRDISEKHERVTKELAEKESELSDLLLQKDSWTTSEHSLKRQADRLENRLAGEIESLKQQKEAEVGSLQATHRRALSELSEALRKSEQTTNELQSKAELAERQRTWEAAALERQTSLHAVEKDRLQGDLEELQQERLRLERQADLTKRESSRLREEVDLATSEAREGSVQVKSELASHLAKAQLSERSLGQAKQELQACETRAASAASDCARLQSELREERARAGATAEGERQRMEAERRSFERQMQSLQIRARQDEQKAVELLHAQEALRQRWQAEIGLEKDALEAQIERLSKENRGLREKSRNVLKVLALKRSASGALAGDLPLGSAAGPA